MNKTPPDGILPIIHNIRILHKDIYSIAQKLSKRDKLGIHASIDAECIKILSLAVDAAFKSPSQKRPALETLRLKVEVLKHLIRTEQELSIIDDKTYLRISKQLVEISKMTNGWINFVTSITQKELPI